MHTDTAEQRTFNFIALTIDADEEPRAPSKRPANALWLGALISILLHLPLLLVHIKIPEPRKQLFENNVLQVSFISKTAALPEATLQATSETIPHVNTASTSDVIPEHAIKATREPKSSPVATVPKAPTTRKARPPSPSIQTRESRTAEAEASAQESQNKNPVDAIESRAYDSPAAAETVFDPRLRRQLQRAYAEPRLGENRGRDIHTSVDIHGNNRVRTRNGECFKVVTDTTLGSPSNWQRTSCNEKSLGDTMLDNVQKDLNSRRDFHRR